MITISVISHRHGTMVADLLGDLSGCPEVSRLVLTYNVREPEIPIPPGLRSRMAIRRNVSPKGFGANHNAAFKECDTQYFCVVNPDVRLGENPFPILLQSFKTAKVALCAPAVLNSSGALEDSVRRFPDPLVLLKKLLGLTDGRYVFDLDTEAFSPDWVAGMFMLFRATEYAVVKGFDEGFFLYYEDVDLCARLWKARRQIFVCPRAVAFHAARRESHFNCSHMRWHIASMARYFAKYLGRLPCRK